MAQGDEPQPRRRLPSGIPGLDTTLGGGFVEGSIYLVAGEPGAGKTIFGNQVCFRHAAYGGRPLFITLLAESHGQMLANQQMFRFFERQVIGDSLNYLSGYDAMEQGGLKGLLSMIKDAARRHRASLLVIDGFVTAEQEFPDGSTFRRFIHELQALTSLLGCTVLLLSSGTLGSSTRAEHTMVDGILELRDEVIDVRAKRSLTVRKHRASAALRGRHAVRINNDGLTIFPRLEALYPLHPLKDELAEPACVPFGIPRLDALMEGGLSSASNTLLLGSTGAGKTILGLHFLAAGAARGEASLYYGFNENRPSVQRKGDRLGLDVSRHVASGSLHLHWQPPLENELDELADDLLGLVARHGIKRLFIDGLVGFKQAALAERRLTRYLTALACELSNRGVTALFSEETREMFVRTIESPVGSISAIWENVLFMRQVESRAELQRLITVMKTRDSAHDPGLYQMTITDHGIEIGERFAPTGSLLRGHSYPAGGQDPLGGPTA